MELHLHTIGSLGQEHMNFGSSALLKNLEASGKQHIQCLVKVPWPAAKQSSDPGNRELELHSKPLPQSFGFFISCLLLFSFLYRPISSSSHSHTQPRIALWLECGSGSEGLAVIAWTELFSARGVLYLRIYHDITIYTSSFEPPSKTILCTWWENIAYRFFFWVALSLYSVLFKPTLTNTRMQRNSFSSNNSNICFLCFFARIFVFFARVFISFSCCLSCILDI